MLQLLPPPAAEGMYFDHLSTFIIHINDFGNIELPLSLQKVENLVKVAVPTPSGHGFHNRVDPTINYSWQISRSNISFPQSSQLFFQQKIVPCIQSIVLNQQGIDVKGIEAKIHLARMILYHSGCHYTMQRNVAQESGHFGNVIIQIPVEGGHQGGELQITENGRQKTLKKNLYLNSDRQLYINFLNVDCKHHMEPIVCGWRVELEYQLFWIPPLKIPFLRNPINLSPFLVTLTKLNSEVYQWLDRIEPGGPTKMMIVGLDNNYNSHCHSLSTLRNEDQHLATLFCSLPTVNVHLACVERIVTGIARPKFGYSDTESIVNLEEEDMKEVHSTTHSITCLIDINNRSGQFHDLDKVERKFIGSFFKKKPDRVFVNVNNSSHPNSKDSIVSHVFYLSALVVWSKRESFYIDIRHRFDYLLDYLERELIDDTFKTLTILQSLIFNSDWKRTDMRMCRLLNLCLSTKAKREALHLLRQMVEESIGVPTEEAAILISELECKLIGWDDCGEIIRQLLTCKPNEQLGHFTKLAEALLYRHCVPGFIYVSSEAWLLCLKRANAPTDSTFTHDTLISCIQMFVNLEDHLIFTDLSRLDQIVSFYAEWPLIQQCKVIIDLQTVHKNSTVFQNLYFMFCDHLAKSFHVHQCSEAVVQLLVDVFRCFLPQLFSARKPTFDLFLENVLRSTHKTCQGKGCNCYLEKLTSSIQTLKVPRNLSIQLLEARITDLNSAPRPKFTWQQKEAQFPEAEQYPKVVAFLQSDEQEFVMTNFNCIQEARNFSTRNFGAMSDCVERGYSALLKILGNEKYLLVKTRDLHEALLKKFEIRMKEIVKLQKQLYDIQWHCL